MKKFTRNLNYKRPKKEEEEECSIFPFASYFQTPLSITCRGVYSESPENQHDPHWLVGYACNCFVENKRHFSKITKK